MYKRGISQEHCLLKEMQTGTSAALENILTFPNIFACI